MDLKKIQKFQEEFDREYFSDWKHPKSGEEGIKFLQYTVVALTGEWGEFANIVKKIFRDLNRLGELPTKEQINKIERGVD